MTEGGQIAGGLGQRTGPTAKAYIQTIVGGDNIFGPLTNEKPQLASLRAVVTYLVWESAPFQTALTLNFTVVGSILLRIPKIPGNSRTDTASPMKLRRHSPIPQRAYPAPHTSRRNFASDTGKTRFRQRKLSGSSVGHWERQGRSFRYWGREAFGWSWLQQQFSGISQSTAYLAAVSGEGKDEHHSADSGLDCSTPLDQQEDSEAFGRHLKIIWQGPSVPIVTCFHPLSVIPESLPTT